ncbi:MAG: PaeR7I family type II restriction endonuclease [Alsobacter sp.]
MPIDLSKYEEEATNAIKLFWGTKDQAALAQAERGVQDVGTRAAVTAGKHLDAFVPLLSGIAKAQGLKNLSFQMGRMVSVIPGYFRPTKEWDLIVMHNGQLAAVFELKSIGSSFGNNMNNRSEEAIGAAHDFWTAYREGAFGKDAPRPFLGWVMIMRECEDSTSKKKSSERFFPVFPEFKGASYAQRADILCRKLVQENLYTATALMLTDDDKGKSEGHYRHLSDTASFKRLLATYAGHMAGLAAEVIR